jgi:hypothetical protein
MSGSAAPSRLLECKVLILRFHNLLLKEFHMDSKFTNSDLSNSAAPKTFSVRRRIRRIVGIVVLGFALPVFAGTPQTVAIRTDDGVHFLTATNGGGISDPSMVFPLDTNRTSASTWETFTMSQLNSWEVAFQTYDGYWVTAVNGGGMASPSGTVSPIQTNATQINTDSTFVITPIDDHGHVTIQTCNGDYLTANNGGYLTDDSAGFNTQPIHTNGPAVGTWQSFSMVPSTCPPKPVTYNQVNITVATADQTGGANQEAEVVGKLQLNGAASPVWLCLKPSSIMTDPSLVCPIKPNAPSWAPWSVPVNNQSFALSSPVTLTAGASNFGTLQLWVFDWGGGDNTAIQGIKLTASGPSGTTTAWFDDGSFHAFAPANNGSYSITGCFLEISGSGGTAAFELLDGAPALDTGPNNSC